MFFKIKMTKQTQVILILIIALILFLVSYPFPEKTSFNLDDSVMLEYSKVGGIEGHTSLKVFNDGSAEHQIGFFGNIYRTPLSSEDFNNLKQFINQEEYIVRKSSLLSKWFLAIKGKYIKDFGVGGYLVNHNGKIIAIKSNELVDSIRDKIIFRTMKKFAEEARTKESEEKQLKLSCDLIKNSQFRSIEKKEIGLGPDGLAMGYWGVSFSGNEVIWRHSDVAETGIYSCSGNIINVKLTLGGAFKVSYEGNVLRWQGDDYVKLIENSDLVCPAPKYVSPHCPKVITKARNIKTGEVKEFPDGCLPECWESID